MSETGYYLATLEASIAHILEGVVEKEGEVQFNMKNMSHINENENNDSYDIDDENDSEEFDEEGNDYDYIQVKNKSQFTSQIDATQNEKQGVAHPTAEFVVSGDEEVESYWTKP